MNSFKDICYKPYHIGEKVDGRRIHKITHASEIAIRFEVYEEAWDNAWQEIAFRLKENFSRGLVLNREFTPEEHERLNQAFETLKDLFGAEWDSLDIRVTHNNGKYEEYFGGRYEEDE